MYFQIIKVKRNIICLILLFHEQGKEYEYEFQESHKLPDSRFHAKKIRNSRFYAKKKRNSLITQESHFTISLKEKTNFTISHNEKKCHSRFQENLLGGGGLNITL